MSSKKNRPEDAEAEQQAKAQEAAENETPKQEAQGAAQEEANGAQTEPAAEAAKAPADDCTSKLAAEHDRYLRLAAEYDNYRKRSQRERENRYNDVRSDTVTSSCPCTTTSCARSSSPPPTRPTARASR